MSFDPVTAKVNLPLEGAITEGDDYTLTLTFEDDSGAIDISSWTLWITVKENVDDTDAEALIGPTQVTSHTDPTNGITQLTLDSADTSELNGRKFYDVQAQKASGDKQTYMKGGIHFGWGATDA